MKNLFLTLLVIGFFTQANAQKFERDASMDRKDRPNFDYVFRNGDNIVLIQNYFEEKKTDKKHRVYEAYSTVELKGDGYMEYVDGECENCGPLLEIFATENNFSRMEFVWEKGTFVKGSFYRYIIIRDLSVVKSIAFQTRSKEEVVLLLK